MIDVRVNDRSYGGAQYRRMSDEQLQRIHFASLEILERTGVTLHDPRAIDLFRRAGAWVSDGNRVRIPSGLVEKALVTVPKRVVMCDRYGHRRMFLEGTRSYFGPGSDLLNIIDHRTNMRRKPVLSDVRDAIVVCDALADVDFVMSLFLPSDVDGRIYDRYQMEVMLNHTTKPIVVVTPDFEGLRLAVEMAEVAVGGVEALQRDPMVACYINVTNGLVHNEEALQKLMYLAEKRLPALYIPLSFGGTNAPVTLAGLLACNNAGVLVGLMLSQLVQEGAPFVAPGMGTMAFTMRTMYGASIPDTWGLDIEMAHYYGLPCFGIIGSSAKIVDQQCAIDKALRLEEAMLGGANLIHDMGYLENGLTGSLSLLVIENELIGRIQHWMRPVEINEETLALDVIDELGPEGNYLEARHTATHYKEHWYPPVPELFDRAPYETWVSRGSDTLLERASKRVDEILSSHVPDPLPADASRRIHAMVEDARARLKG